MPRKFNRFAYLRISAHRRAWHIGRRDSIVCSEKIGLTRYCGSSKQRFLVLITVGIFASVLPLIGQTFKTTGTLNQPRADHTATLLANGLVLVAGGYTPSGPSGTAELFDPTTGSWHMAAHQLNVARAGHASVRLSDGRVLLVGGVTQGNVQIGSAELFDPQTESFTLAPPLSNAVGSGAVFSLGNGRALFLQRLQDSDAEVFNAATNAWTLVAPVPAGGSGPAMTVLNDGRVLVCGGGGNNDVEIYSPVSNTWQVMAPMAQGRSNHTATTLPDGRVLIASGLVAGFGQNFPIPSVEIYDPTVSPNGASTLGPNINGPGPGGLSFASVLLPNGKILISGGGYTPSFGALLSPLSDAATFDSSSGTIASVGEMNVSRHDHTATVLNSGLVLLAGGVVDQFGALTPVTELFGTGGFPVQPTTFAQTGSMAMARSNAQSITLNSGKILITGGVLASGLATNTAELYDPASGSFTLVASVMTTPRVSHAMALLPDGRVLVCGGQDGTNPNALPTTDIYEPTSGTFTAGPPLHVGRYLHQALALTDGRIIVVSGFGTATVETFDPVAGAWSFAAPLPISTWNYGMTRLSDGRIFISGGSGALNQVAVYSPSNNTWVTLAPPLVGRQQHAALALPNGKVLIAGGNDGESPLASSELYDPAAQPNGTTTPAGSVAVGTGSAAALSLPNGQVWLAGGNMPRWNGSSICAYGRTAAQLYDSQTNTWTDLSSMLIGRYAYTAALLPSGQILLSGGVEHDCPPTSFYIGSTNILPEAEIWTGSMPTAAQIQVTTNYPGATFTIKEITGAATYNGVGKTFVQPNAPLGTYSITYGPSSCVTLPSPNPDTEALTAAGLAFTGNYGGSLTVTVTPTAATSATFSISPPIAGFPPSAPSSVSRTGVPPGHYLITFNDVPGWNTPAPQGFDTSACTNTTIQGVYTPKTGPGTAATMTISVNNLAGGFTITSTNPAFPGPLTCPGSSPACISNTLFSLSVPVGTYTIQFKDVTGTFTPLAQRVSLISGQQFNTAGYYRKLFLIGFTGYNNAPSPSDCFHFLTNQAFRGSGDQYGIAQLNQPGMGIGTAVLSALNNVQLKQAIRGTAFTFYEIGNGDACTAPTDDSDHKIAGNWIQQMAPLPDDWIVVIGHSYGGNRAQLFSNQVQMELSRPVDLLVTIDPIRWTKCHIQGVLFGADGVQPCNQTFLPTPVSTARQVWAYYQTIGVPVPNLVHTFLALYGYIPLNSLYSKQIPDDHLDIDDDVTVQSSISQMLLTAVNGARLAVSVNGLARAGATVSLSWTMTLQPMLSVSGMTITSATLNGVTANNLSLVSNIGDVAVGNMRTITLQFPSTVGAAGSNGTLVVTAQNALGQAVTCPSLRVTLP